MIISLDLEITCLDSLGSASGNCIQEIMTGEVTDFLISRGSSLYTSFLEIPPDLLVGQRSRFDCGMSFALYTDMSYQANGLRLHSECHNLRIDGLIIGQLSNSLLFGTKASRSCLSSTIPDDIASFPSVLISDVPDDSDFIPLGTFLTLRRNADRPEIATGLNPITNQYLVFFPLVTVMMFGTTFTSTMTIDTSQLSMQATVQLYNVYSFNIRIIADTNTDWDFISFEVDGTSEGSVNLNNALQQDVSNTLIRMAREASTLLDAAMDSLEQAQNVTGRLTAEKDEAMLELQRLQTRASLRQGNINESENTLNDIERSLEIFGNRAERINIRLMNTCELDICNLTCVPGLANSTCTDITLEPQMGLCRREVVVPTTTRQVVSNMTFDCEDWQTVSEIQSTCDCVQGFDDCSCTVSVVENSRCEPIRCEVENSMIWSQ